MPESKKEELAGDGLVSANRRARHDYEILETFEAGLVLTGSEVKSLRSGKVQLKDSFVRVERGEAFLWNAHISPYAAANRFGHEPERSRKLLLHREEIEKLGGKVAQSGLTVVPLKIYFKNGRAKVELAVGRGRKYEDRREAIKERDSKREADRALRRRRDD